MPPNRTWSLLILIKINALSPLGSLVEKHAQHQLIGLLRQVGEEKDLVRRRIVHIAAASMA